MRSQNCCRGPSRGHILTVRDNIAANLRALCAERGSFAQCCREAGINRQQFNRYITGEAIPNRANLQKICEYFDITDTELFQAPQSFDTSSFALGKLAATVAHELNNPLLSIISWLIIVWWYESAHIGTFKSFTTAILA